MMLNQRNGHVRIEYKSAKTFSAFLTNVALSNGLLFFHPNTELHSWARVESCLWHRVWHPQQWGLEDYTPNLLPGIAIIHTHTTFLECPAAMSNRSDTNAGLGLSTTSLLLQLFELSISGYKRSEE